MHLCGGDRLAHAGRAFGAMARTEAIEQALMALMLLATAVAVQLLEQVGMLLRGLVSQPGIPLELLGIQRESVGGYRPRPRSQLPADQNRQDNQPRDGSGGEHSASLFYATHAHDQPLEAATIAFQPCARCAARTHRARPADGRRGASGPKDAIIPPP